jgi:hypothetical protein
MISGAKHFIMGAACALLLAGPALAAPPPPKAAAMARPAKVDPAALAAAKDYLAAVNADSGMDQQLNRLTMMATQMAAHRQPNLDVPKFQQVFRAKLLPNFKEVSELEAEVLTRHFTVQELKAMAAFYHSPAGRKMLTENPKVMQDLMPIRREKIMGAAQAAMQEATVAATKPGKGGMAAPAPAKPAPKKP